MTHDCDRAAECPCYQAGYLNGQQTDEWTLAAQADVDNDRRGGRPRGGAS